MITLQENRVRISGKEKGELRAQKDYREIIEYYDNNDGELPTIILDFSQSRIVGMSFIEGYVMEMRDQKFGSDILKKIIVQGNNLTINRFGKYVG